MGLAGCSTAPKADDDAVTTYRQYRDGLVLSTQAINAGDLDQARVHLEGARAAITNAKQERKVDAMDRLIAGTEALRDGNPALAKAEWSRIEERRLRREVTYRAHMIGIDVPEEPIAEEEGAIQ